VRKGTPQTQTQTLTEIALKVNYNKKLFTNSKQSKEYSQLLKTKNPPQLPHFIRQT